jgi:deazaflavin-dependent oxidoreductase (nitroreductase family)
VLPRPFQNLIERAAASDILARFAPSFVPELDRMLHRLSGGRVMITRAAVPSILLTTTGARSGQRHSTPLAMFTLDGVFYVVGSNFGGKRHPGWSYNLLADPRATMSLSARDMPVRAELLDSEEKAAVWPRLVKAWPPYDRYVERSHRDLRVFRLTPSPPEGTGAL